NLTYSLSVTNFGPAGASHVSLTDVLPADVSFLSASIGGYTLVSNVLTFTNLGALVKDASLSFTVTVQPTVPEVISNYVSVTAAENDTYIGDNSASVSTTVLTPSAD